MPISAALCEKHISQWENLFSRTSYRYRVNWPSRLFRHEPLENAVAIIREGALKSRTDAAPDIVNDIAPAGIIDHNDTAHGAVRLYFRPRTPTQWNIEGIREPIDMFQGKQCPVLYMFLFDARKLLTSEGVRFSDGNMQSYTSTVYDDDAGFQGLDFSSIYHEGPIMENKDHIRRSRCAEVLLPSPHLLKESLEAVICRSDAERQLILHELGSEFKNSHRIRVFKEPGMFQADFTFVESADLSAEGLVVKFNPPRRGSGTGA